MDTLSRVSTRHMIAINLLLFLWVWGARLLVGTPGWVLILFPFTVGPVLLLALVTTTVMTRRRYPRSAWTGRPGQTGIAALSRLETLAQLVTWTGLLGTGFFLVDGTDASDSERSVFTALVGGSRSMHNLSYSLTTVFAVTAVLGWLVLVTLLVLRGPDATAAPRAEPTVSGTA